MTKRFDIEELDLLKENAWAKENRFPIILDMFIGAEAAIVLARLFWPEFVEHRGGVFVDFMFHEETVNNWIKKFDGDATKAEPVVNHTHLWDMFQETSEHVPAHALTELGEILCRCWRHAVEEAFPDRDFVVALENEPDDYGPTLYLYTKRPEMAES
jgi:hypothetical protein